MSKLGKTATVTSTSSEPTPAVASEPRFSIEGLLDSAKHLEAPAPDPFPRERHAPATSIAALITLVELAEQRLNAAGHDTRSVIHVLRGIFYGTTWSMDHDREGSAMRDVAFQIYTTSLSPDDPRPIIGESLYQALKGSAEVQDPTRPTDFGHLIIGLDSSDAVSRNADIPFQGGTGQAINTWLGDLGGGAGMLAINRGLEGKSKLALKHFVGSDYGGAINLEGDVAGVVGVQLLPEQTLADALRVYFTPSNDTTSRWNQRAALMLTELGGLVVGGVLVNKTELVETVSGQIEEFGAFYAVTRLADKGRSVAPDDVRAIGRSLVGAAVEMATIFIATLEWAMGDPSRPIDAQQAGCNPPESPPSERVPMQLAAYASTLELGAAAGGLLDQAGELFGF